MIPREHLPLTLVTVALLGFMFIMYRELNALKRTVAQLSVPAPPSLTSHKITGVISGAKKDTGIDTGSDSESDDDTTTTPNEAVQLKTGASTRTSGDKKSTAAFSSILKSSKEKSSATA